jgi:hypothetical protein
LLSWCSDWLRAGRPRPYSIPDMDKSFLYSVQRSDQIHVPPTSLYRVYWGIFAQVSRYKAA